MNYLSILARNKNLILVSFILVALTTTVIVLCMSPADALAGYMKNIDGRVLGNVDTASNEIRSNLYTTGLVIIRVITNGILLPIAITFFIWKLVYIALFLVIMGIDPLDIATRNNAKPKSQQEMQTLGKQMLKTESIANIKWLIIVALVFMIINFIIWLASVLIAGVGAGV